MRFAAGEDLRLTVADRDVHLADAAVLHAEQARLDGHHRTERRLDFGVRLAALELAPRSLAFEELDAEAAIPQVADADFRAWSETQKIARVKLNFRLRATAGDQGKVAEERHPAAGLLFIACGVEHAHVAVRDGDARYAHDRAAAWGFVVFIRVEVVVAVGEGEGRDQQG